MNKLYFVSIIFLLFFIPAGIYATEKNDESNLKQIFKNDLLELDDSPYTMKFTTITKNSEGQLVSVIYGRVYAYLPHQILDDYLNKFPSEYIVKDDLDYKKWAIKTSLIHQEEKAIHGSEVKADWCTWLMTDTKEKIKDLRLTKDFTCQPKKDQIVIIRADHASLVVDKGDTTDYFLTVLKRLS